MAAFSGPILLSAATGIDQKIVLALLNRKAGIITPGHHRIAGPENNQAFVHVVPPIIVVIFDFCLIILKNCPESPA